MDDTRTDRLPSAKWLVPAILLLALLASRFWRLDADFPSYFIHDTSVVTDEGQYAASSIEYALRGRWRTDLGFNPIIGTPVWPILLGGVFAITGVGLVATRALAALLFVVAVGAAVLIAWRTAGAATASLTGLLLATNHYLFAYSRIGLLDGPATAFALVAICLATRPYRSPWAAIAVPAGAFVVAICTKANALGALPALAVALLTQPCAAPCRLQRKYVAAASCLLVIAFMIAYRYLMRILLPSDMAYFEDSLSPRVARNLAALMESMPGYRHAIMKIGSGLYALTVLAFAYAALRGTLRHEAPGRFVLIGGAWILGQLAVTTLSLYRPERYFVPLAFSCAMFTAGVAIEAWRRLGRRRRLWGWAVLAPVLAVAASDCAKNAGDLLRPRYTFVETARAIAAQMRADGVPVAGTSVIGYPAHTLSLVAGFRPVTPFGNSGSVIERIATNSTPYYVSLGLDWDEIELKEAKEEYRLEEIAEYKEFDHGRVPPPHIHMFRLHPKD